MVVLLQRLSCIAGVALVLSVLAINAGFGRVVLRDCAATNGS